MPRTWYTIGWVWLTLSMVSLPLAADTAEGQETVETTYDATPTERRDISNGRAALLAELKLDGPSQNQASNTSGGDGSTIESAIVLPGASNEFEGTRGEHDYIRRNFPGWKFEMQEFFQGPTGRIFDAITIVSQGQRQIIYFDITDWFGKLE